MRDAPELPEVVAKAARRVRSQFVEIPALRLTLPQARRLSGLDEEICISILDELVREGWLTQTPDGKYVRPQVH